MHVRRCESIKQSLEEIFQSTKTRLVLLFATICMTKLNHCYSICMMMENAGQFVVVMRFILPYIFFYSYITLVFWLSSKYYNSFLASKCICKEEKTVCKKTKTGTQCNKIQNREILCEKNGKFVPSGGCAGDERCTGPISSYAAECGKTKLCEPSKRITLSNLRAYDNILQHFHERNYLKLFSSFRNMFQQEEGQWRRRIWLWRSLSFEMCW